MAQNNDTTPEAGWYADDGNAAVHYPDATSSTEAARAYVDGGDWGDGQESFALRVHTWRQGTDEDGDEVRLDEGSHLIVVHPDEPECPVGGEHQWSDDFELVGGITENPGVWSSGGCGIRTLYVCTLCGLGRHRTSASQGEDTEYDHERVRYEHHTSVDDLAEFHRGEIPDEALEEIDREDARALVLACLRWRALEGTGWSTSHEDQRDWYDAYGWHLPTEREGDVELGAVAYTDLDEPDDDTLCERLRAKLTGLTADEASAIVARAREIREAADTICGLLDTAEERWDAGDITGCIEALTEARREELDHGDSPATDGMAAALFGEPVWTALRR